MEIKVTMTVDEFEEFRTFQKDAGHNKKYYSSQLAEVRATVNDICNSILRAVRETSESTVEMPSFVITDQHQLASAVDGANEWFA